MKYKKIILGISILFIFLFTISSVLATPYYIDDDLNTWVPVNVSASSTKTFYIEKTGSNSPDFNSVFDSSLEAFYPFLGNAKDVTQNNNDGTVNGSTLTTDEYGNSDSAYSFEGNEDHITITGNPTFHESTFSTYLSAKFDSFPTSGNAMQLVDPEYDGNQDETSLSYDNNGFGSSNGFLMRSFNG